MGRRYAEAVLLLHGIRSKAPWFAGVEVALRPWFVVGPARYSGFESPVFGFLFIMNDEASSVIGVLSGRLNSERLQSAAREVQSAWTRTVASVAPWRAVRNGEWVPTDRIPHVIAHSWGSLLWRHLLLSFPELESGTAVIVGSPLPSHTPLDRLAERVTEMHNVVQLQDELLSALQDALRSPWAGQRLAGALHADVGNGELAGAFGLFGNLPMDRVHSTELDTGRAAGPNIWQECSQCRATSGAAFVHNWHVNGGHSTVVSSYRGVFRLLRPLLWGFSPGELWRFSRVCRAVTRTGGNEQAFRQILLQFRLRPLKGHSIASYLRVALDRHPLMEADADAYLELLSIKLAHRYVAAELEDRSLYERASRGDRTAIDAEVSEEDARYRLHPLRLLEEQVHREHA